MRCGIIVAALALLLGGMLLWLHRRDVASEAAFETGYEAAAGDAGTP